MRKPTTPRRLVRSLSRSPVAMAVALLSVSASIAAAQQALVTGGMDANFEVMRLTGGFTPDPQTVRTMAGGDIDVGAASLGRECVGYATAKPDVIVSYRNPAPFVRFYARALGDVALAVHKPDGSWACSDNAIGHQPMVSLNSPAPGVYRLWVTGKQRGQPVQAVVGTTELRSQTP